MISVGIAFIHDSEVGGEPGSAGDLPFPPRRVGLKGRSRLVYQNRPGVDNTGTAVQSGLPVCPKPTAIQKSSAVLPEASRLRKRR